ncbi:flagellar hook protein FlgE [Thiomicrorhabdus sp. zzn3]|uniref:flagellar hook protein FlgE n=1 Tax=Thiomicrorhabdus sp. zzn3 TaxID=3039775 RepID=UPI00243680A6|nr:flagellar hook protein FlgE [Thiomicrorhabdus sp. zzn3]MDG6777597.1 flagellar hook protein FlgE [Thiomicrorhabdus sp. zzn3]
MGVSYDLNALSGINAASTGLGVISNNLANAQSVGFKGSRAEFADMFSGAQNSPGNGARVAAITQDFSQGTINGTGRELDMAIDGEGFFVLEDQTGRYDNIYTRNGSFKLDKDGYLTSQEGNKVQGYLLNQTLSTETNPVFETTLGSIDLDELNKIPKATDEMTFDINLDGQEINNIDTSTAVATETSVGSVTNLPNLIGDTYGGFPNFSTNKIVHDTLGGEHRLTANFYKRDVIDSTIAGGNSDLASGEKYTSWLVQYTMQDYDEATGQWVQSGERYDNGADGITGTGDVGEGPTGEFGQIFELRFDTNGNLIDVRQPEDPASPGLYDSAFVGGEQTDSQQPLGATAGNWASVGTESELSFQITNPLTGATDPLGLNDPANNRIKIDIDFSEMTQFAGTYNLRGVSQNGYSVGDLVGLNTGLDGVIEARYSNGRSVPVAQLALANFSDKNAMEKLGAQNYAESFASGTVQLGSPQSSGLGSINAGSLEYSNVDVAAELVNMIQTQRTYQASAQVISTSQQLTQTILNL